MALQADLIAVEFEVRAVRLVAVAAGQALREHLALLEGLVIVSLVLHLPVGKIEGVGSTVTSPIVRHRRPPYGRPMHRRIGPLSAAFAEFGHEPLRLDFLFAKRSYNVGRHA
jgi:hypothetical protein